MSTTDVPAGRLADSSSSGAAERCPECRSALAVNERFPTWCPSCEWNLVPAEPAAGNLTPRQQRRAARAERREEAARRDIRERSEQVFKLVSEGGSDLKDGSTAAAFALAGAVNLVSLTVLLLGLGLVLGLLLPGWPGRILGVFALAVAFQLRPRLGRPSRDGVLDRAAAPTLYALVDRISEEVGAPKVDSIAVDGRWNASFGVLGLRRHRQLTIGLPLWTVLTPQQRVAVLGHELGHCVNGDSRRGLWTGSALNALIEWYRLTVPERTRAQRGPAGLLLMIADAVANRVLWVLNRAVYGLMMLMNRLFLRSGQAAEYRADLLGVRLTSVADTRGALTALLHAPTFETVLNRRRTLPRRRAGAGDTAPDLWQSLAEAVRTVPPLETERRLRTAARQCDAVDSSHPPTHLRLRMLTAPRPEQHRHPVVLDSGQAARIEAELADRRKRIAIDLL
ncbi:M48 family metalloprotease [Kitasatospora sp. NPDC092948]|uniref:M48 family metalloprotease n=1 Tax=Kitasatospora sp. NPDC092948 TaxID=3364088 RepID=UPI00380A8D78